MPRVLGTQQCVTRGRMAGPLSRFRDLDIGSDGGRGGGAVAGLRMFDHTEKVRTLRAFPTKKRTRV